MPRAPLLGLLAAFVCGIVAEEWSELHPLVWASCAGCAVLARTRVSDRRLRRALVCGAACSAGALALALRLHAPVPRAAPGPVALTLLAAPEPQDDRCAIVVWLHGAAPGAARIFARDQSCLLLPGQLALARLESFEPFPARGNPGGGDLRRRMARRGIHRRATAEHGIVFGSTEGERGLRARIERLRRRVNRVLEPREPPTRGGALLRAMVTGDRSRLDPHTERAFQSSGTAHLLAVSGLNVAFVLAVARAAASGGLWLVPSATLLRRRRSLATAAGALAALAYALLAGSGAPVLRAAAMGGALAIALLGGRPPAVAQALVLAALVVLSLDPAALFEAGFVLSFSAVAGLLLWGPAPRGLPAVLHATVAAGLATAPWLAHYGLPLPAGSVVANLLAVPFFSALVVPLGLAVGLLGTFWPAAAHAPAALARALCELGVRVLAGLESDDLLAGASRPVAWAVAAAALCFAVRLLALERRRTAAALALCGALALGAALLPPGLDRSSQAPSVWILDVGQGDAALVEAAPVGILVDAGSRFGRFDAGRDRVLPALRALGVRGLDAIAVTHADLDHLGGVHAVLEAVPVRELWLTRATHAGRAALALRARAARLGVPVRILGRGDRFAFGAVDLRVLWPPRDLVERVDNAGSLVLEVRRGPRCVLLPGDVTAEVERLLARDTRTCQALKLAHHGSRTSSDAAWLDGLAPEVAITSAGGRRRHPLPHREVHERLRERGITHYRTERDGAVRLWLGPGPLAVHPFREPR